MLPAVRSQNLLGLTLAMCLVWGGMQRPAQAIRLSNGTVYFVQPPRLEEAITTQKATYVWGATYYFTLSLPENADEPLQRVVIHQREGGDRLEYRLAESQAFLGTRQQRGSAVPVSAVIDPETNAISVTFDPPVSPGQSVTLALRPIRNPRFSGVYLLGVTAFPAGDNSHGQFLGFGRLHFYDSRDAFFPGLFRFRSTVFH